MHIHSYRPVRALICGCLFALAACGPDDASSPQVNSAEPAGLLPPAPPAAPCMDSGRLSVRMYGALRGEFDLRGGELSCEGMPRPEGMGARLRFAGDPGEGVESLVVIVAIPGLARGETLAELPSNVTLIEEGAGRFFSTPDLDHCWTDVLRQAPADDRADVYEIDGAVYCIGPLGEVNGSSSISIERLEFRGLLDWSAN